MNSEPGLDTLRLGTSNSLELSLYSANRVMDGRFWQVTIPKGRPRPPCRNLSSGDTLLDEIDNGLSFGSHSLTPEGFFVMEKLHEDLPRYFAQRSDLAHLTKIHLLHLDATRIGTSPRLWTPVCRVREGYTHPELRYAVSNWTINRG